MTQVIKVLAALATAVTFASCAPQGPHVRVATATAAELQAVQEESVVWYEFQPGDVVPVQFGFLGVAEGGSNGAVLRATRQFFIVASKNGPIKISFDGKTFANANSSQSVIAILPREDGQGGSLLWLHYMGEDGDPDAELERVIAEGTSQPAEAPAAAPPAAPEATLE